MYGQVRSRTMRRGGLAPRCAECRAAAAAVESLLSQLSHASWAERVGVRAVRARAVSAAECPRARHVARPDASGEPRGRRRAATREWSPHRARGTTLYGALGDEGLSAAAAVQWRAARPVVLVCRPPPLTTTAPPPPPLNARRRRRTPPPPPRSARDTAVCLCLLETSPVGRRAADTPPVKDESQQVSRRRTERLS